MDFDDALGIPVAADWQMMKQIEIILGRLENVMRTYHQVPYQQEQFDRLLDELREIYKASGGAFSDELVYRINEMNGHFAEICSSEMRTFGPEVPDELEEGAAVVHEVECYAGVIVGRTEVRSVFEEPDDRFEFRVRLSAKEMRVASPRHLRIVGTGTDHLCFGCRALVGPSFPECPTCLWRICAECGECGCQYGQHRNQ